MTKREIKGNFRTELETERLKLVPWKMEYSQNMYDNWARDKEVTKYLTWELHKNIEETKQVVMNWIGEANYNWAITLKDKDEAIGSIAVVNRVDKNFKCEIGYCLSRKYWKQGIMTEALKKVIEFLFSEGYFNIVLKHAVENVASGKVMQKAGMTYAGRLPYDTYVKGKFYDCDQYYIINPNF